MPRYYTEYPLGEFDAPNDTEALKMTNAAVVYRESDTVDGTPFINLRDRFSDLMETLGNLDNEDESTVTELCKELP